MSTTQYLDVSVVALRGAQCVFGPWYVRTHEVTTGFISLDLTMAATTLVEIVGGVAPVVPSITDIAQLGIFPDQVLQIGLHGVDAQAAGFTLNAHQWFWSGRGSINALSLYNTAAVAASVVLIIGGS